MLIYDKTTIRVFKVSSTLCLQHSVLRLSACSSGHTEKAVACFQAMIELNCFCSPDMEKNTPVTGQIAFLETFWDSGQARYGTLTAENLYMVMLGQNRPLLKEMATVRKVLPLLQVQIYLQT